MTYPCHDRWQQTREQLSGLLAWLEETHQWVVTASPADDPLDDEARRAALAFDEANSPSLPAAAPDGATAAPPDLFTCIAEITSLRQEVKLQTRGARQDREQAARTLEPLAQAVAELERSRAEEASRRDAAVERAARSALDVLLDLHDALSRSVGESARRLAATTAALRGWATDLQAGAAAACTEQEALRLATPAADPDAAPATPVTHPKSPPTQPKASWLHRLRSWWASSTVVLDDLLPQRDTLTPGPSPLEDEQSRENDSMVRASAEQVAIEGSEEQGQVAIEGSKTGTPARPCAGSTLRAIHRSTEISRELLQTAQQLDGLADANSLLVCRIERALSQFAIEPIPCIGLPLDPQVMEAVQTVAEPEPPAGTVTAEVRCGYRRHGKLLRYAQVVVNRGLNSPLSQG